MKKIFTTITFSTLLILSLTSSVDVKAQSFNNENKFELHNGSKKMALYPTPATNFINISIPPSLRDEIEKIEIYDISGRRVLDQKYIKNSSEVSFNNISNLNNGVYIVGAKDKEGRLLQSSKMIISK